jgi:formylglycine-generating enzyme required for sulfatase activity
VRLYSLGVQVLLNRWQKRKGISVSDKLSSVLLDDRKLRTLLERIAYEMHARGRRGEEADLSRGELLTLLEQPEHLGDAGLASEFLDYVDLRAGLLVGSGGEYEEGGQHPLIYTFPHRTFQEYLVGCHMVNQRAVGREYWRRLQEGDIWYLAAQLGAEELLYERRNTTSFLDLAYDLCPEAAPSTLAKWRAVLLSGHMAALIGHQEIKRDVEQPGGGTVYLNRLLPSLSQTMRKSPLAPVDRAEAGRILARLGDPRVEVSTLGEMEFSWIPAGPFLMKSEHSMNRFSDDARTSVRGTPSIQVELDYGYWIALYPVTNAQFQKFIEADGYSKAEYWVEAQTRGFWSEQGLVSGEISFTEEGEDEIELTTIRTAPRNYGTPFDFSNHPVVGVSWYEAAAFSQWLTEQWHENGLLPEGWRVDLPSEIEWEKAATGGLMIPSEPRIKVASTGLDENPTNEEITVYMNPLPERTYPWGDEHTVYLTNCAEVSIAATSAVGCFPQGKSVYGSEEMSGNIWEWTRTEHEARQYSPLITSLSTSTEGKYRGCRGGSFVLPLDTARCGVCDPDLALRVLSSVGFRLVVVPSAVINSSPV